jgi:hypothetical protein
MTLPETDLARVRRWVDARNAEIGVHIDEMRVEADIDARAVTIVECRPPWPDDIGSDWIRQEIARLRSRRRPEHGPSTGPIVTAGSTRTTA